MKSFWVSSQARGLHHMARGTGRCGFLASFTNFELGRQSSKKKTGFSCTPLSSQGFPGLFGSAAESPLGKERGHI